DVELRRQLVQQALEAEGSLDEARRTERLHRRRVQLRRVLERVHVVARVEHLHRTRGRGVPARPAERGDELAFERGERAVGSRARTELLDRRVAVPRVEVLLATRERAL